MTTIDKIVIEFIDHNLQRFPTCGDYKITEVEGKVILNIWVSRMNNQSYECLVAIHEFVEWMTTDFKGIKEEDITFFDLLFEREREQGLHTDDEEPGFDPRSIYLREHTLATSIEMTICAFLGIPWTEYDKTVEKL